jgi:hypothetical protein
MAKKSHFLYLQLPVIPAITGHLTSELYAM